MYAGVYAYFDEIHQRMDMNGKYNAERVELGTCPMLSTAAGFLKEVCRRGCVEGVPRRSEERLVSTSRRRDRELQADSGRRRADFDDELIELRRERKVVPTNSETSIGDRRYRGLAILKTGSR